LVTVDPGQDSPERVQEYVNHFNSEFIGLSGSETELQKTWNDYGVFRQIVEGPDAGSFFLPLFQRDNRPLCKFLTCTKNKALSGANAITPLDNQEEKLTLKRQTVQKRPLVKQSPP